MTTDEMTNRDYDYLMNLLCPWGSLDVWHMVKNAEACDISMNELAEILQEQADTFCVNLYDYHTDVNALLNDYILQQARNEIDSLLEIDIQNDYDVYFFANYLDCPLQYSNECKEAIEEAIKEKEATAGDFNKYALYVLDEMGVTLEEEEE